MKHSSKTNIFAQKYYLLFSFLATLFMVVSIPLYLKLGSADLKQGLAGIDIILIRGTIGIGTIVLMRLFLPGGKLVLGRESSISKGLIYGLPYLVLSAVITIISNLNTDFSAITTPPASGSLWWRSL